MNKTNGMILLSLTAIVMVGCEKKEPPFLDREEVKAIISKYLENPQYDVKISMEMEGEDNVSLIADVVGHYRDKTVAVKYEGEVISAAPTVSPKIDYFLEFPSGDESFVKSAMESLKDAKFTPVLAHREDLGTITPIQTIQSTQASFRVRNASEGQCQVEDETGIPQATFALDRKKKETFSIPEKPGLKFQEGSYSIICSFSNYDKLSIDDLLTARFAVSKYDFPQYGDGLKDMGCSLGKEKKLEAHFTPKGKALDVVYYSNGKAMKSNVFKCDKVGRYIVKAIATDKNGLKAESPEVEIDVIDVREEFFEGEGGEGESY